MLRAVAALMVVYTHSISQVAIFASGWQQRSGFHIGAGTFGVDLFFVISGFIIFHTAGRLNGATVALTFLWHRFRRINPLYYIATALTLLTWLPSLLTHRRPHVTGMELLSWLFILPAPGASQPAVFQAWTLSYEWYFYLLFFGLILFRLHKKAAILTLWSASVVLLGWLLRRRTGGIARFIMDPALIEFLIGATIALAYRRFKAGKATARLILWLGVVAGLVLMGTGYYDYMDPAIPATSGTIYFHALYWGGASALIVAGSVFLEKKRSPVFVHPPPVMMLLGDASYSIYLFHMLVFGLIGAVYLRVGFFLQPDWAILAETIVVVLSCLLIYKWVELPLMRWLKKFHAPRINPPPASRS